ncbi:carboxypeptidase regulatory-like domain-containing protein [Rugamonas sp. FT107W]|uniref:Carboxypeptidase regulatory-like domain-containing protein n=1 Tax=Duganella vulcania TaxID=2692166 RepID=A0A845HPE0_9BURK|nr:carboxypeptidase regulatory-like domain-containing protein [Duganella vulcania]MYN20651.1 carboxypeptidase regulatory-like domain-containing protein [Duganella vulcania]
MYLRSWVLIWALAAPGGAMAAELAPRTQNGIVYLSGGVGEDEQQAMQAARADYPVRLTFSTKGSGEYRADVALTILDRSGAVLATLVSPGPLCYLKLAPGSYRIVASVHGKELSQALVVQPLSARELYFYWDPE